MVGMGSTPGAIHGVVRRAAATGGHRTGVGHPARVLLLDEPLSALDARLRSGMLAELARLHRELPEVSILYVTHDQVEALTLADRIAVMDRARLQECGTPRELYRAPKSEFTASFVGSANLLPVSVGERGVFFGEQRVEVRGAVSGGRRRCACGRIWWVLGRGRINSPVS